MKVMIFGTFDHLHAGHMFVLKEAQKRGEVTAIVARDHHVKHIKGRPSVQSENNRVNAIRGRFPDIDVRLGDETDFLQPIREVLPQLILLGYDQALPPGVSESDFFCEVERLPAFEPHIHKSSLHRAARPESDSPDSE